MGNCRPKSLPIKSIEVKGLKIGKRLYSGLDIEYGNISPNQILIVHIFKKEPVRDEWEISADICDGEFIESKIVIYTNTIIEQKLHRHHKYQVSVSEVYRHHVRIFNDIIEVV